MTPIGTEKPVPCPARMGLQCNAKSRQTGNQCKNRAVKGRTKCRMHGGLTPSGAANGNWKHGRYSKVMPANLGQRYRDAVNDPELLSARDEVAVLQARVADLLSRLSTGQSAELWGRLREAVAAAQAALRDMNAAVQSGNEADFAAAFTAARASVADAASVASDGRHVEAVWKDVQEAIERKTRVAKREWDRMVDLQAVITAGQAMALVIAIQQSVLRHCTDRKAVVAISRDIEHFTTQAAAGRLEKEEPRKLIGGDDSGEEEDTQPAG